MHGEIQAKSHVIHCVPLLLGQADYPVYEISHVHNQTDQKD